MLWVDGIWFSKSDFFKNTLKRELHTVGKKGKKGKKTKRTERGNYGWDGRGRPGDVGMRKNHGQDARATCFFVGEWGVGW